jgi:hypothetical protein
VAPRLRSLAGDPAGCDVDAIERDFLEAAARCVEGDLEQNVREMTVRKTALGTSLLDPSILQAAIFYDIAVRNASRERDEAPRGGSPRDPEEISASPPPGERPLECPGTAAPLPPPPPVATAAPATAVPAPRPPRSRPPLAVLTAVLGMATAAAFATWGASGRSVRHLAEAELDALSPHLEFAYRNGSGSGPLFVGTLAEAWEGLTAAEREQSARHLSVVLRRGGVREMILYDAARRIAVHAADPLPLRIAPAARARATHSPAPGAERSGQS